MIALRSLGLAQNLGSRNKIETPLLPGPSVVFSNLSPKTLDTQNSLQISPLKFTEGYFGEKV